MVVVVVVVVVVAVSGADTFLELSASVGQQILGIGIPVVESVPQRNTSFIMLGPDCKTYIAWE